MTKNGSTQAPSGSLTIIVRPYKGRYIAICKEAGIIREASSFKGAKEAVFLSIKTLLKEIQKYPEAAESLEVGLSFDILVFFYWSVLLFVFLSMCQEFSESLIMKESTSQFAGFVPAHG